MKPIPKKERILTTSLFRGSYFLCNDCDLINISFVCNDREDIAEFEFIGSGIIELEKKYRNGKALVNPVQFETAVNELRDHLFKAKRDRRREKANHKNYKRKIYRNN